MFALLVSTITQIKVLGATSSPAESGNPASNAYDGTASTRFASPGLGSWIQFDLGTSPTHTVNEIDFVWYMATGEKRTYTVNIDFLDPNGSNIQSVPSYVNAGGSVNSTLANLSVLNVRYVKLTLVKSSNTNNWFSITDVTFKGSPTAAPSPAPMPPPAPAPVPPPAPPAGLDENGVKEIYATSPTGIHYVYKMTDNIESSNYVTTDQNAATQMTEGNITFKRLTANDVHYSTGTGKTVRVNVNGGGFLAVQTHTWQNTTGYIWTSLDSKNSEFTYYFRVVNYKYDHTSCSTKMHSGIHTSSSDPRASCFETCFFIGGSSPGKMEAAYEYNHPNYVFESVTQNSSASGAKAGQWIGRKTCVWTGADGKVHTEDYCDWAPFDNSGKPVNNWTKVMSKTFGGTSTNGYTKVPSWGGMNTIRIDGYEYVDISILSIREIVPPS